MNLRVTKLSIIVLLISLLMFASSSNGAGQAVPENGEVKQEQTKDVELVVEPSQKRKIFSRWLHMLDEKSNKIEGELAFTSHFSQVPQDLAQAFNTIGKPAGSMGVLAVLLRVLIAIVAGFCVTILLTKMGKKKMEALKSLNPPKGERQALFFTGFMQNVPSLIGLSVFMFSSIATFLLLAENISVAGRMLFLLLLGVIITYQLVMVVVRTILSPDNDEIRVVSISSSLAQSLTKATCISISILVFAFLMGNFLYEIGLAKLSLRWSILILGSAVIAVYALLVVYLKQPVVKALLEKSKNEQTGWLKQQFYAQWHLSALLYLCCIWFLWINQQLSGDAVGGGSFIVSMLVVPIYFILSAIGIVLIASIIDSLGIVGSKDTTTTLIDENAPTEEEIAERRIAIISKIHGFYKLFVIAALTAWLLSLWGYQIPFAGIIIKALFQSIIIIGVALIFWSFASSYLARKIAETTPEVDESEDNSDDEFGGAVAKGRGHTLLPMVRKVLGSILVVMVVLVVISSLGVNIGPLLAGAGVLGLAVGFGAQKLVSDIFSGFFFLLDDAFRVGEYIQAGSIKGTVEGITLRNVMLRHHLGMLQIVPHSDLGAITNCMRGGMVIKFPLEFPYDADIDKVRKIIKKVGQAMLLDEELGDDFILPVKSQGVNEITNSVMVIRVKFTAKPGKQFVIKREAFRRITEALNAKGIYYAHRKVIVDLPHDSELAHHSDELKQKVLQAGAATVAVEPLVPELPPKKESGMFS
ncbi:MAG: mechanosensitive ion channel family protein [Desulfotalea sp.]